MWIISMINSPVSNKIKPTSYKIIGVTKSNPCISITGLINILIDSKLGYDSSIPVDEEFLTNLVATRNLISDTKIEYKYIYEAPQSLTAMQVLYECEAFTTYELSVIIEEHHYLDEQ